MSHHVATAEVKQASDREGAYHSSAFFSGKPMQYNVSIRNSWYRLIVPVPSGSKTLKMFSGSDRNWEP